MNSAWLVAPWIVSCQPKFVCRRTQVMGMKRTWRTSQLDGRQPSGEDGSQKPDSNIHSWRLTQENMRGDTGEKLEEERRHGITNRRQQQRSVCSQRIGILMRLWRAVVTSEAPRTVGLQEDLHNHQKRLFFFLKSVRQLCAAQLCVADMMCYHSRTGAPLWPRWARETAGPHGGSPGPDPRPCCDDRISVERKPPYPRQHDGWRAGRGHNWVAFILFDLDLKLRF